MAWDQNGERGTMAAGLIASAGGGALRLALLFGSGAVALALILVPVLERQGRERSVAALDSRTQLDMIATGSIAAHETRYTIRRSVLQANPAAVCIITSSGHRSGQC